MKKSTLLALILCFMAVYGKAQEVEDTIPYEQLRNFANIYSVIKNRYVDELSDEQLLQAAIDGMVEQLDSHSSVLKKADLEEVRDSARGRFQGIGVELNIRDDEIVIVKSFADTPASRAGLMADDTIVKVDEQSVDELGVDTALSMLSGEIGSKVKLHILRDGQDDLLVKELIRANVRINSLETQSLGDGIYYAKIVSFQQNTASELRRYLLTLSNNVQSPKGLILDLRGNPGGVLDAAVDISDLFIESGTIVSIHSRIEDEQAVYVAKPDVLLPKTPIIVMIDEDSASAAEIVAGALKVEPRVTVFGERSYGKGSVQHIIPVSGDTALKLTVSEYHTPDGKAIHSTGIVPDIRWASIKKDAQKEAQTNQLSDNIDTDDKQLQYVFHLLASGKAGAG